MNWVLKCHFSRNLEFSSLESLSPSPARQSGFLVHLKENKVPFEKEYVQMSFQPEFRIFFP
jgi:beta-lactamase class D